VILIYGDEKIDALLILSQVVLSLQLGFAIIPLIHFVSDKSKMKEFAIKPVVQILSWLITVILVTLNLKMIFGEIIGFVAAPHLLVWKVLMIVGCALLIALMITVIVYPLLQKRRSVLPATIHPDIKTLENVPVPEFSRVAIALDFSLHDEKLLAFAIGQGKKDASIILLHVVESASAKVFGEVADDLEARKDEEQLAMYMRQLEEKGINVVARLGYRDRKAEILRIVREEKADLLIMGAHGHSGVKDWLYGETINQVRHELKIPVLLVSL
jgi:manganese transport protein